MGCPVARYGGVINEVLTNVAKGGTSGLLPSGSTPIPRCGASLVKLIDPTTILPLQTLTFDTLAKYVHTCKNHDCTGDWMGSLMWKFTGCVGALTHSYIVVLEHKFQW